MTPTGKPPRSLVARTIAALLSTSPTFFLRSRVILAMALVWAVLVNPFLADRTDDRTGLTLKLEADDAGRWLPPPVPGSTGLIVGEIEISRTSGPGWQTITYRPNARFLPPVTRTPGPTVKLSFAEIYDLWLAQIDARSPAANSRPAGLPGAEQRRIVALLADREAANAGDASWTSFEPMTVESRPFVALLIAALRWTPALLVLAAAVLFALRYVQRYEHASRLAEAENPLCPFCRHSRYGLSEDAPCTECGAVPSKVLAEASSLCLSCGYSRRSLKPDDPCPECGQSLNQLLAESRRELGR